MAEKRYAGFGIGMALFVAAAAANAQPTAPEPPPPVLPWYEALELNAFVDVYGQVDWGFPKPQSGEAQTRFLAKDNGFAVSWAGAGVGYEPDPVGGTLELRVGPAASRYAGRDAEYELENIKQAFASFRPGGVEGDVTFDFGKFDTAFGAESAESQENFNYTRGVMWAAQPFFHAGLRTTWQVMPELSLMALVVNGANNTVDNNIGKSFGLIGRATPLDGLTAQLGYFGGPEQDDFVEVDCPADTAYSPAARGCGPSPGAPASTQVVDRGNANDFEAWQHLVDLVVTIDPLESLSVVLNADYNVEGTRSQNASFETDVTTTRWYGAMLAARYELDATWAVAVRGEYLVDEDGRALGVTLPGGVPMTDLTVATATLTLEARPTENLILRLENRGDFVLDGSPDDEIYKQEERETSSSLLTTTLGVVVTTN